MSSILRDAFTGRWGLWLARAAFIAWAGFLVYSMLATPDFAKETRRLIPWDKASHVIGFYVLTLVSLVAFPRIPALVKITAFAGCGLLIELIQPLTGRDLDLVDAFANLVGIVAVYAPFIAGHWARRLHAHPMGDDKALGALTTHSDDL